MWHYRGKQEEHRIVVFGRGNKKQERNCIGRKLQRKDESAQRGCWGETCSHWSIGFVN